MYPEHLILIGAGIGLALGNVALRVVQSEWCRHRVAVWQWRRATRPRPRTREALANPRARRARRPVAPPTAQVPEQRGGHQAGDRVGVRPAPATNPEVPA